MHYKMIECTYYWINSDDSLNISCRCLYLLMMSFYELVSLPVPHFVCILDFLSLLLAFFLCCGWPMALDGWILGRFSFLLYF